MPRLDQTDWPAIALQYQEHITGIWVGNCVRRAVLDYNDWRGTALAHAHIPGSGDLFIGWLCFKSMAEVKRLIEHETAHLLYGRPGHDEEFYRIVRALMKESRDLAQREG